MRRWMIAAAVLGTACTAGPDTGDTDTDDTGVVDTSDTGQQQVAQWRDLRIETSTTFNAVYTGGTGAWIAGNGGALYRYERGEGTQVLAPGREDLRGIWGVGDEDPLVFAVGTAGEVLTRQRGSGTVTADDLGTTNFEDVDGLEGDLTAVGWGGVYRLDGEGWSFENTPGAAQINGVRAFPDGTAVAVSNQGTILERGTDGVWARADAVTSRDLHAIAGEANDLWIVGASGIVLHNDGSGWTEIDSGTSPTG